VNPYPFIPTGFGYNRSADVAAGLRRLELLVVQGRMSAVEADRRAFKLIREDS
jgi:hypothetical protein